MLIPRTKESADKIIKALLILEDQVVKNINLEWFTDFDNEDNGNIRIADEIVIDLMFKACGETYETLKPHSQIIFLDGVPVKTVDLEGLIKTKNTVRDKDRIDCLILEGAIDRVKKTMKNSP